MHARILLGFGSLLAMGAIGVCACARTHEARSKGQTMSAMPPGDARTRCPAALIEARKGGSDPQRYVVPDETERATMREAIRRLVADGWPAREEVARSLADIGFELVDVAEIGDALLVRELGDRKRGGGAYVVRPGSRSHLLVETPHTFFDEGTLPLGCELFQRTAARGLFIETAHRYKSAEPTADGESPADVAHAEGSLYQAATEGFLAGIVDARVVQLHGFGARGNGATIVLSSGAEDVGQSLVDDAADQLRRVSAGVLRFPEETNDLGATQNVQGALVRRKGGAFLHVEIAAQLRRDLLSNPQRRADVLGAIAAALEDA
jgi:hypothetical protein